VELSFKHSSKELNELHLTFNRVVRTINLATLKIQNQTEEEQAQALLNYADAYHIYDEFDRNHSQKGVCLANIGSIMMQMGDYSQAREYYDQAILNMKGNIDWQGDENIKFDSRLQYALASELTQNKFLLACRLFMRGMARLESVRAAYPLRSLLAGRTQDFATGKSQRFSQF